MNTTIEHLQLSELKVFLRDQAEDGFPDLKDEHRLNILAEKWNKFAGFCTCRDENNQLVGMIAFYANQPESGLTYIPHVYVSSKNRRKGLFSKMLDTIENYVKKHGFSELRLEVLKNNVIAQTTYLRKGFTPYGDASPDSIYMYKIL